MDYKEAFIEALLNKELVKHYDRLFKRSLSECIKSITKRGLFYEIDLASGRISDEIIKFDAFFYEYIWSRLPEEALK